MYSLRTQEHVSSIAISKGTSHSVLGTKRPLEHSKQDLGDMLPYVAVSFSLSKKNFTQTQKPETPHLSVTVTSTAVSPDFVCRSCAPLLAHQDSRMGSKVKVK